MLNISIDEELQKELLNAIAAYADILWACCIGCEVPKKFEAFKQLPQEDLEHRVMLLHEFKDRLAAAGPESVQSEAKAP